jgi:aerobic carbon-monoxide dehydrogenase large subunit
VTGNGRRGLVGARTPRVEDERLLTGRGRYVDDLDPPGMLHAAFVRSPIPHGRLVGIDVSAARELPGVALVLTAADLTAEGAGPAGGADWFEPAGPEGLATPPYPPLADGKVRYAGEAVALVVADTRARAEDACELVEVEIDPLPAITGIADALDPALPPLFDDVGTNVFFRDARTYGDPDAAFARAGRVVRLRIGNQRIANVPMEGRAGLAEPGPGPGELTYHVAHQNPHAIRAALGAQMHQPLDRFTVKCGDIGGSFGQKAYTMREDVCVCVAARTLGRPVKWVEDRVENFLAGGHARDEELELEAAVADDGTILGVRVHMTVDQGAYQLTTLPSTVFPTLARVLFPNAYRIRDYSFATTIVATNKATYVAYRGPWESETWARERLIDVIAHELGLEPVEVRARNLLAADELPSKLVTGPTLAFVTARETLDEAVQRADLAGFRAEQAAARRAGRHLGFGVATYIEASPGPPDYSAALGGSASPRSAQSADVRLEEDGTVTVFTSQQPHGQGHETTLAQLAADGLDLDHDRVRVVHGDTDVTPFNLVGTGGSRAATLASGAVVGAVAALRARIVDEYARRREVDPADVEVVGGAVQVRGVPASAWDLARVGSEIPGLTATHDYAIPEGGWSQATHCCWVDVDVETGLVRVPRYLVVEDCGSIINPAIVDGQIAGGVMQGLASVLYERFVYDGTGQPVTTTLLDYLLPTACEAPPLEIVHLETPPQGPINFRGVGENGFIGAPAAVANAVEDALAPYGVRITERHLSPSAILDLIADS